MAGYSTNVGNVELVSLSDGYPLRPPLDIFPSSTLEEWREFPGLLDANDQFTSRFGAAALRSGGKTIIVDTGLQAADGIFMEDMKKKGVDREAVDLVVFTHLHPDHVGWNLTDGRPNFPNARYLLPKVDWDHWTQPAVMENAEHVKNQIMPLKDLNIMDLMDDEYNVTDEVRTVPTPGHTPGHVSLMITSQGQRGFILGDVANNLVQAHHTDWCPIFDNDPDEARKTRHKVMDMLESEGLLIYAGHFPDPGFGHLVRTQGRRLWQGI